MYREMAALLSYIISLFSKTGTPVRSNKYNLPLPKTCHFILDETTIAGRDVFIIGDVHGCYDEMCELMDLARLHRHNVLFVFAGDMINKGPKSVEVIQRIRQIGRSAFAVRGNHEECVLREVRNSRASEEYELNEKYQWIAGLDDDDVEYIRELPYTIAIPSLKVKVVHAGLLPEIPEKEQALYTFTNMRNVIVKESETSAPRRLEVISKIDRGQSWTHFWKGPEHVYFGHDARRGLQLCDFATGLDTGCVYGGRLMGTFVTGATERLSVKSRQTPQYSCEEDE